jgi:Protein of unknown function (DUF2959)
MRPAEAFRPAMILGLLLAWPAASARAQDEGVKQIEDLVKAAGGTSQAIAEARLQLTKTIDAYNALLSEDVKDRKGAYKKLQQEMGNTEKRRADIRQRASAMNLEAEILFKKWDAAAAAIESPDLRKRSEDRLAGTKASYSEIGAAAQKAAEVYQPLMKALQDQVTYLSHDLNADSVASLKPDAAKLNAKAQELIKQIDETIAATNNRIAALRP